MSSQSPLPTSSNSNTDTPRLALHGTNHNLPPPPTSPRNGHPYPHRIPSLGTVSIKKRPSGSFIPAPLTHLPPALPLPMPHPGQNLHAKPTVPDAPPPFPKKASSRPPSIGSPEEVASLDFHSTEPAMFASPTSASFEAALTPTFQSKSSSVQSRPPSLKSARQPSVRSRSSSTAIGLVEEVTPWELYPPIPEKNTKYHIPSQAVPEQTLSTLQTSLTGSVEEVTPWELVPPPETLRKPASRAPSYLKSVDEVSVPQSFDLEGNDYAPSSPGSPAIQPSHISTTSSQDKVQKTGPAEDVTPWELEPGPAINPAAEDSGDVFPSGRLRSSLTLAQVEDITPWELHPASFVRRPTDSNASETDRPSISGGGVIKKKPSRSGNPFAANNKTLSDLAFVRGRKHGNLPSKSRLMSSSMQPSKHRTSPIEFLPTRPYDDGGEGVSEILPTHALTNSSMPLIGAPPSPVNVTLTRSADTDASAKSQFNLSTADRKILSQLEFVKDAHDKEFVLKGKGYQQQGGGVTPGKFHHVYHEKDAPYPRCYDSKAQDLDVWEIMVCHQICESWTWHVFEMPPRTVLDIGCGTGSWVVQAAGEWKDCHFWGIDLVPIQPNFNTLGDRDLKERVHWVHHNILNGLPFEDEQFDYIHIKRIGLGVPENRWDGLFEECNRVLKPGGAFEMIEEDLIFPGKPHDNSQLNRTVSMESDRDPQRWSSQSSQTSNNRVEVQNQPTFPNKALDTLTTPVSSIGTTTPGSPLNPMTILTSMSHVNLPEPSAASPDSTKASLSAIPTNGHSDNSKSPVPPIHVTSQPGLTAKPTLYVKTPSSPQANPRFSNSAVSLLSAFGHHASTSGSELAAAIHKRRLSGLISPSNDEHLHAIRSQGDPSLTVQPEVPAREAPAHTGKQSTRPESYLLKQYMAPMNPRDHIILDTIYSEMLSSRFINAAPLSLLQNYLEYHFTDIRTHPPVLFSFPPTALLHSESRYVTDSEPDSESSDEISSDEDEARNALRPKPPKHKNQPGSTNTRRSRYRSTLGKPMDKNLADTRVLSRRDLIHHQSPYISLDESRAYAFSPSTPGKPTGPMRVSRIPNAALNFDLKTLNMHLHLRTVDILGCSESMWEWVLQYQADLAKKKTLQGYYAGQRIRPMQSEASLESTASTAPVDPVMNGIAELTREDYEILLANFEMDMQDQASVDYALQEQVNWHVSSSPRDIRRKAFDEACKKWDRWVIEQEKRARYFANHRHPAEPGEIRNDKTGLPEQHRYSHGGLLTPSASKDGIIHNQSSGEAKSDKGSSAKQELSPFSPVPFSPSRLPPHERLSRAFRVYVAWKARDTNSPNQAVSTSTGLESLVAPA